MEINVNKWFVYVVVLSVEDTVLHNYSLKYFKRLLDQVASNFRLLVGVTFSMKSQAQIQVEMSLN